VNLPLPHLQQLPPPPPPLQPIQPAAPSAPAVILQVAARQAAQEQLAETIAKTVEEMPPNIPPETKEAILAQNIQEEQQKLVSEGNLAALEPKVVKGSSTDESVAKSPRAEKQPAEQPLEEESCWSLYLCS